MAMGIPSQGRLDQRGFTLTELLVAIALVGLIMTGILSLLMTGNQSYLTGSNQVEAQAALRAALEKMTLDIREAGYDPQGRGACAPNPVGPPAGPVPANCYDAITNASGTSFTIQSDWNGSGAIEPAAIVSVPYCFNPPCPPTAPTNVNRGEQITYTVVGGALCRQESAVDPPPTAPCPAGQPLVTSVQPAASGNGCTGAVVLNPPTFQYCDVNDNLIAAPVPAANVWQIATVVVNMQAGVQNQPPVVWQTGAVQVAMSDRIRLRNR